MFQIVEVASKLGIMPIGYGAMRQRRLARESRIIGRGRPNPAAGVAPWKVPVPGSRSVDNGWGFAPLMIR